MAPIFDEGSDTSALSITRETLEVLLRRLVTKDKPSVRFVNGTVIGFQKSADGRLIDELLWRTPSGAPQKILNPGLVVDATGASQSGLKWLNKSGFTLPATLRIQYQVPLHYVTIFLRLPPH
ncbi:hypothetical protein FRC02_002363 [Tulasnella sp. 418]|nr:hypothetical protein FRC02_002363 [Tulasnella sp. 418]